jgi:hypothetical protein
MGSLKKKENITQDQSALSLFQFLIFVAEYLENAVSHRYISGNARSFITAAFEMCKNSSFRPAQKLIGETSVYVSFKPASVEMSINLSYYYILLIILAL